MKLRIFNYINFSNYYPFIIFIIQLSKCKIFLGDSGAYTLGALVGLNTIITNNLNPEISSFFLYACFIFFWGIFHFLETFTKKSPIYPDDNHLHMLSFYKISSSFGKIGTI